MSAKHRSKFAAVTGNGDSRWIAENYSSGYKQTNKQNSKLCNVFIDYHMNSG
jgi:hypothetical protein